MTPLSTQPPLFVDEHRPTVGALIARMRSVDADAEVVSVRAGLITRRTFGATADRIDRLCAGLAGLGVGHGTRVATFAWNTHEHVEAYLGVPAMGALLHTVNVRLDDRQVAAIVTEAEDQVLLVDGSLLARVLAMREALPTVRCLVVLGELDAPPAGDAIGYEALLDAHPGPFAYPVLDERLAAGLCHTSGTTGAPKGVLYSHRSQLTHAMALCMSDTLALGGADRILPAVSMYHGTAWGLPYAAALTGADLVLPGADLGPAQLAGLIEGERVTMAAGVPTIWSDLLGHADAHGSDLSSLRLGMCGGVAAPEELLSGLRERHGVRLVQAWGMTETRLGTAAPPAAADDARRRATAGRLAPGLEARLVGDDGHLVAWDGSASGLLEVRAPWISTAYFGAAQPFAGGWLATGDIAAIDAHGFVTIVDRAKDVIKSGGEWIPSVALEDALRSHPGVRDVAVIARPDARWTERPLACVVPAEGVPCAADAWREHLAARVARWWIPETFAVVDGLPRTSVGKVDKRALRARLAAGGLEELAGSRPRDRVTVVEEAEVA